MSTTALHLDVQRSRFAQLTLASLGALFSTTLRRAVDTQTNDAAREAAAVRELANRYVKTDPGFAEDLYAAANRHESIHAG